MRPPGCSHCPSGLRPSGQREHPPELSLGDSPPTLPLEFVTVAFKLKATGCLDQPQGNSGRPRKQWKAPSAQVVPRLIRNSHWKVRLP